MLAIAASLWSKIIGSKLGRTVAMMSAALLAFAVVLWRTYSAGEAAQRAKQAAKEKDEYIETRKKMDEAGGDAGDPDADREWLRDYSDRDGES